MIKDSGNRTEFSTGAVRDVQEGKGRCDLLPLDVAAYMFDDERKEVLQNICSFVRSADIVYLRQAVLEFCKREGWSIEQMILEVAIHFEEGAKKYGERNWEKGIPISRYIDSGVRHALKHFRRDDDERHDRAFCWNMLCAMWTCNHKPDLVDI